MVFGQRAKELEEKANKKKKKNEEGKAAQETAVKMAKWVEKSRESAVKLSAQRRWVKARRGGV